MVFVRNNQAPKVLKPGKHAFNLPSTFITAKFPPILSGWFFAFFSMRCNHFNTAFIRKSIIKAITVVCFITNNAIRCVLRKTAVDGRINQLYFMGRSAFNVSGDRKTSSVCDCHDLGAFAAFCLADSKTPFFAGAKLPSMNASRISILPRSFRSSTSSVAMRRKTPCRTHCWNRRWHVWYGGYLCGKSFHGAPVRKIHNIPFMTSRGSLGLRPRGSFTGVDTTIMGSIRFHCSLVSSILIILHIQNVMSRYILNYFKYLCVTKITFKFKQIRL